jgi:hypothetical protein
LAADVSYLTLSPAVFAWTSYEHVHWIAPMIGTACFGFAMIRSVSAEVAEGCHWRIEAG